MTDSVDEPLDEPPDGDPGEDEPDEPDDDDGVDWASADFSEDDLLSDDELEQMVEPVADGAQDMPEEEPGWAKPFNRPKRFEPRAV
jgi:hypothetical protein